MKKRILLVITVLCMMCLGACSKTEEKAASTPTEKETVSKQKLHGNVEFRDENGKVLMNVEDVEDASVVSPGKSAEMGYGVNFVFTEEGSQKFADITSKMIGKKLEIYVENKLIMAPIIKTAITEGEATISNMSTYEEAEEIVKKIKGN